MIKFLCSKNVHVPEIYRKIIEITNDKKGKNDVNYLRKVEPMCMMRNKVDACIWCWIISRVMLKKEILENKRLTISELHKAITIV